MESHANVSKFMITSNIYITASKNYGHAMLRQAAYVRFEAFMAVKS
jgi:hypothetical protein